jgi:hypothetical protein
LEAEVGKLRSVAARAYYRYRPWLNPLLGRPHWGRPDSSPQAVYLRWRGLLSGLVSTERFAAAGLENHYESRPGKYDRNLILMQCLRHAVGRKLPGAVAEFGCLQGHTALQMVETLKKLGDAGRVLLFDSFQGMPTSTDASDRWWSAGGLSADYNEVVDRFKPYANVEIVRGFLADTLPKYADLRLKFAHVDVDMYTSTKDVNRWLLDKVEPGGFVIYDDYGFGSCEGEMKAVDEDMQSRTDYFRLYLPTGQYVAMKL